MFQEYIAKKNQTLFNLASVFFSKELGLTNEEMEIIIVQEVNRLETGTSGTCTGSYNGVDGSLTKVEIRVLGYASVIGMIDVLAHELVHARQHVRGEFHFEKVKHPIFFGLFEIDVNERFHKGQRLSVTPYYERLCEIEAHTLSYDLVTKFCAGLYIKDKTESKKIEDDGGISNDDIGTKATNAEEGSILSLS